MNKSIFFIQVFFALLAVSCEKSDNAEERMPDENYNPLIDPENFVSAVNNNYFPLVPGQVYYYTSETNQGARTVAVAVLPGTREVCGVTCTVVKDVVRLNDEIVEESYDWYAQDKDGNVWYFGEDVTSFKNGIAGDKQGSFEAGVDGALPGIIMLAEPVLEMPYRKEYKFNVAEGWSKVMAKGKTVSTPYGTFNNCIVTVDWSALERDAPVKYKYYAPGIGLVKEESDISDEVLALVSIN